MICGETPLDKLNHINRNLEGIEQEVLSQRIDIGFTEPRFEAIVSTIRSWVGMKWVRINKTDVAAEQLVGLSAKTGYKQCIEVHGDHLLVNIPGLLQTAHLQGEDIADVESACRGISSVLNCSKMDWVTTT